ncbi:hypothetical protein Tco_0670426 [Tanacetum coccineum]
MNFLSESLTARIKEQVKDQLPQILPQEVSNFAPPVIEKLINESRDEVTLAKVSLQPQSTYEAASTLTEFELKKILLDKIEKNESYLTAPEHRDCYDDKDKDEDPSAGSDRGLKKRKLSKDAKPTTGLKKKDSTSGSSKGTKSQPKSSRKSVQLVEPVFEVADSDIPQDQEGNLGDNEDKPRNETVSRRDWFKKPTPPQKPTNLNWNYGKTTQEGPTQIWLMTLATSTSIDKSLKDFDELMNTLIDFSEYILNGLKIENLTQEILLGPAFRLLKGTRSNYAELEYDFEECYKYLLEKLDWENPEGGDYPFDLSKPLPLIMRGNRQRVPFEFFINNDLKYLQGGILTKTYTMSTTKTKTAKYDLPSIEDMASFFTRRHNQKYGHGVLVEEKMEQFGEENSSFHDHRHKQLLRKGRMRRSLEKFIGGRKAHLLEDNQIPNVGVFDEVFLALNWHLKEIHVTWAHLEKKQTRLGTYTKSLNESCSQSVEMVSIMSCITAQQTKLDLELVPKENRIDIGKCNERIPRGLTPREPTFLVVQDATALTLCYPAFLITADAPEVYMHQFWNFVYKHDTFYRFKIDKKKRFKLNLEVFRDIFQIFPRVPDRDFDALPSEEDTMSFLRELGHTGEINSLNDVVADQLHQPWRTFATLINRSLSGKTSESTQIYGAILPECLTSPAMNESKVYKTYLGYAISVVPPKIAKKFKKASSSKKDKQDEEFDDDNQEEEDIDQENESEDDEIEIDEDKGMDYTTDQFDDDVDARFKEPSDCAPLKRIVPRHKVGRNQRRIHELPFKVYHGKKSIGKLKDQLPQDSPQDVSNFASSVIKKLINESCDEVTLAKVPSQPQSTYEAASTLIEFELKNILLDKMEKSEYISEALNISRLL